jgi:uncharacterized membrane protein YfcA
VTTGAFVAIAVAVLLGATVQSAVGLGVGLVAAPVTTLLAPELMPGALLMLALLMPVLTLAADRGDIDWPGLGWSLPLRVVGTVVGVWVVATFSQDQLGVTIGVVVLLAALATWRAVTVPITRGTLGVAGFVSGITGTATSIGGPPFAILYQHRPPRQIRTTMAVYFLVGAALSLTALLLTGDLTGQQVVVCLELLPLLAVGAVLGAVVRRTIPTHRTRLAVLGISAASALVLLVRSLAG